jgi:hypothetical protein
MQIKIDEFKLEENNVEVSDTVEKGSATRTLLFGDTLSFDEEGVAIKITRDTVYLTVTGTDEDDELIKCQWEMNRPQLIQMLMSVEGN